MFGSLFADRIVFEQMGDTHTYDNVEFIKAGNGKVYFKIYGNESSRYCNQVIEFRDDDGNLIDYDCSVVIDKPIKDKPILSTMNLSKSGLGFEFHTFPSIFMTQDGGTSLGVYFPFGSASLLIEPLIMYSSSSTEIDYDDFSSQDSETSESDFTLLIGIFIPKVKGKIRSYYGIRFGKQWHKCDGDDNNNNYYNNSCGEDSDNLIIAPTVGAEYFISDNFSFGGEGMYTMITIEEEEEEYSITSKKNTLIPRFIVRFYF